MPYNVRLPNGVIVENIPDDMPQEEARARILQNFPDVAAEQERTLGEAVVDPLASLGVGAGRLLQIPGQIGQLAGLYGAEEADTGLQGLGQRLEAGAQELKSPTLVGREQLRAQEMAQAEGFVDELTTFLGQTVTDPMLLTSFFAEQVPNLVGSMGGGLLARGGVKLLMREATEQSLGRAGVAGAVGTGAAMQGADVGADTYERIFSELTAQGVSETKANERALTQAREAAILAAGATIATSYAIPGGTSIERALAGRGLPGTGGFIRGALGEATQESLEEGAGRLASNIQVAQEIPGTSITEGLGEAVGSGLLAGALFGGPAGTITARRDAYIQRQLDLARQTSEKGKKVADDLENAALEARRATYEAEQAELQRRIAAERFRDSNAYKELEERVDKIKARAKKANDKRDAEYAKFSAFAGAQPDLFGDILPAQPEPAGVGELPQVDFRTPQGEPVPVAEGQLELGLPPIMESTGQLGIPEVGIARQVPPVPEAAPVPTIAPTGQLELPEMGVGRPTAQVTEADFTRMGIGKTNKKLREQILGKDLGIPEQAAQVRQALETYASDPRRSARIIEGVEGFLRRPEFSEQLSLPVEMPVPAPAAEPAAPAQPAPVVTETSLDGLNLPKRSAARKRLLGKDLSKPEDREAVVRELQRLAANPNLNPETRQRVQDVLAGSPFIRTQGELFAPEETPTGGTDAGPTTTGSPTVEPTVRRRAGQRGVAVAGVGAGAAAPQTSTPGAVQTPDGGGLASPDGRVEPDAGRGAGVPPTVETTGEPQARAPFDQFKKSYQEGSLNDMRRNPTLADVVAYAEWLGSLTPEQQAIIAPNFRREDNPFLNAISIDTVAARRRFEAMLPTPSGTPKTKTQDREQHKQDPFVKYDEDGLAFSEDISPELRGIISEWKKLLGLDSVNLYFTTRAFARANQDKYTGPHRDIVADILRPKAVNGSTRRLRDGSHYVTFERAASITRTLETISHEMGHVHQKEAFINATPEVKKAIQAEHVKWVKSLKGKTSGELLQALRGRQGARTTKGPRDLPVERLGPYWTSFSEWYADQIQRWAMSSKKPQTVVEKFFAKVARGLRNFFNTLKGQGYLPNETFKQYLDAIRPDITPKMIQDPVVAAWEDMKPEGAPPFGALLPVYQNNWRRLVERNRATMADADNITESHNEAVRERETRGGKVDYMVSDLAPQITNPILEDISKRAGGISETPPPKTAFQTVKEAATREGTRKFLNAFETRFFSFDAGFSNRISEELKKNPDWKAVESAIQSMSTSQALHADGVASKFLEKGNAVYRPDLHMYEAVDSENNYIRLIDTLSEIAKEEGVSFDTMKQYANQAFIAERINGMSKTDKEFYSNLTDSQVKAGLEFFTAIPRLREVQRIWNGIRQNAMKMATDSGLYTEQEAKDLLNVMDYVPFFREAQLEAGAGPREYGRGLLDFAKGRKIKGSEQKVNDIFDNMERWTSYVVSRSVKNRTANNMLNLAQQVFPDEVTELRQDESVRNEERQNVIDIYVDGQRKRFKFADPLFVDAFGSMASITMPLTGALGGFAVKAADFLRKTVVLVPIFSISQLSQDSFSAMFTSGLKSPLRIPFEVVKEFVNTLRGRSAAHERLGNVAAAGIRDYSATVARSDLEIAAGLKKPSAGRRVYDALEKFAMASDNAVRQAIYNRTLLETGGVKLADGTIRGGDEATAVRRAFEVINFKRSGNSGLVQVLKQVVPFFGAYLQSMNVMYKVLMGRGISPQQRAQAYATLGATTAKVMALAFMYTALVADDDEYKEMDPAMRDRTLMIPGTSFKLPMRPDIFLLPKMIAEYSYLSMTDEGYTDGTKIRRAFRDAIANAILSPTAVPQGIKPAFEVAINYDFFTGRPIIGRGLERLPTEQQYSNYSSELSKILGNTGLIAPVNADHLMRGYFGTAGGMINALLNSVVRAGEGRSTPDVPLPDDIASIPGLGAFVTRTYGTGIKNDFYELRAEVDRAVAGLNWLRKYRTREEVKEYMEANRDLISLRTPVNRVVKQLSKLREQERKVREAPDSKLSAAEKGEILKRLKEYERKLMARVPALRQRAGM